MAQITLAIAGATGNVGREILRLLESAEQPFLKGKPLLLASSVSEGEEVPFVEESIIVKSLKDFDFSNANVIIFATPKEVTAEYATKAVDAGCRVVDLSGHFRTDETVPAYTEALQQNPITQQTTAVSIPDVLAQQLYPVLKEIQQFEPVNVISTALVPVGRAGADAMEELFAQTAGLLGGAGNEDMHGHEFKAQVAFNVIPQVGTFTSTTTDLEMAPVLELNRMLEGALPISTTAVHVPTFVGTSQSVSINLRQPADADAIRNAFKDHKFVMVIDAPEKGEYSTPFGTAETDKVFLSRVRVDSLNPNMVHLWVTCDNLRSTARNAIEAAKSFA